MSKEWMEVTVVTSSEAVEIVTGLYYACGLNGVSILDSVDIEFKKNNKVGKTDWDYFDENLLNIEEGAVIKGYFKDDEEFDNKVTYIKNGISDLEDMGIDKGKGEIFVNKVNEEEWENNWKKYYKPTKIGEKIVVKPTWEEYDLNEGELIVELDPGMAFGTGTHETTRMCVKALENNVKDSSVVFDIGTGSGILAIAASKLGAEKVVGVDLDMVAVESAKKNVGYNNLGNIEILYGDLMEVVEGKADIVVANIMADIIMFLAEGVKEFIKEEGLFISSGIIDSKEEEVVQKLKDVGFEIADIQRERGWVCITAKA